MALAAGVVPQSEVKDVAHALITSISNGSSYGVGVAPFHLNVGVVGCAWIFDMLTSLGADEVILETVLQDTWPSFGFMVAENATTIWEAWTAFPPGNLGASLNHATLTSNFVSWMYSAVAGLDTVSNASTSGWEHVLIRPVHGAVQKLKHAEGAVNTRFGNTSVSWLLDSDTFSLQATIPPGSTATLSIPLLVASSNKVAISEGGVDVWKDNNFISGRTGIRLSSGSYSFKSVEGKETFV